MFITSNIFQNFPILPATPKNLDFILPYTSTHEDSLSSKIDDVSKFYERKDFKALQQSLEECRLAAICKLNPNLTMEAPNGLFYSEGDKAQVERFAAKTKEIIEALKDVAEDWAQIANAQCVIFLMQIIDKNVGIEAVNSFRPKLGSTLLHLLNSFGTAALMIIIPELKAFTMKNLEVLEESVESLCELAFQLPHEHLIISWACDMAVLSEFNSEKTERLVKLFEKFLAVKPKCLQAAVVVRYLALMANTYASHNKAESQKVKALFSDIFQSFTAYSEHLVMKNSEWPEFLNVGKLGIAVNSLTEKTHEMLDTKPDSKAPKHLLSNLGKLS